MAGLSSKDQIEEVMSAEPEQVEKSERIDCLNGTIEEAQGDKAESNRCRYRDDRQEPLETHGRDELLLRQRARAPSGEGKLH